MLAFPNNHYIIFERGMKSTPLLCAYHVKMYDMMIEPINKPRVLSEDGLKRFYDLYVEVRRRDLNFMKHVLDLVEADARKECLNDFVSLTIRENIQWFEECQNKVDKLYCLEGIKYMAEEDPFT